MKINNMEDFKMALIHDFVDEAEGVCHYVEMAKYAETVHPDLYGIFKDQAKEEREHMNMLFAIIKELHIPITPDMDQKIKEAEQATDHFL